MVFTNLAFLRSSDAAVVNEVGAKLARHQSLSVVVVADSDFVEVHRVGQGEPEQGNAITFQSL